MKKYSSKNTNSIIIAYIIKSIISSIICIFCFTFLSSEIIYKFDVDLNSANYFAIAIVSITAFLVSIISVYKIKNNGAIMGILAEIPLLFYMIINAIFNNHSLIFTFIKIILVVLFGILGGIIASKKSKKLKVK